MSNSLGYVKTTSDVYTDLKKSNVSGMLVGDDTIQVNPNINGGYYCLCSYNVDYNGMSIKEIGLGYIMTADKVNGQFVISHFGATNF